MSVVARVLSCSHPEGLLLDKFSGSRSFGGDKGGKKIAAFDWVPKEHRALQT